MKNIDWTKFCKRIAVYKPIEDLYDMWVTRQGIENWFLRMAEFRKPGGRLLQLDEKISGGDTYTWLWHGWGDEVVEHGEILETNGRDYLKFSFAQPCVVEVKLYEEAAACFVELTQSGIPEDEEHKMKFHVGCLAGWTFYLTNLKSILEGGPDLRNKNAALQNVINA